MRQFQQASRLAGDVLADDPNYVDALFVRGLALYNMNNTDQAMRHFRKAMQVRSPEGMKCGCTRIGFHRADPTCVPLPPPLAPPFRWIPTTAARC